MKYSLNPFIQEETEVVEQSTANEKQLIIFNDDINTFDHVISTLIKICKHTSEQAEQCTWIIHFKGKCIVKVGELKALQLMKNEICNVGISAEVK